MNTALRSFAWKVVGLLLLSLLLAFPMVVTDPTTDPGILIDASLPSFLTVIAGVATLFVGLIVGLVKREWWTLRVGLWVFSTGALSVLIFGFVISMQYEHTVNIGNGLVQDIEAYRRDTGTYPASLDSLVPRYREDIPATAMGFPGVQSFSYFIPDDGHWKGSNGYVLYFWSGRCPIVAHRNWKC